MRLVSWNVNGIRACMQKGFMDFFKEIDADVFCIQETKMQPGQLEIETPGYYQYMNSAEKKGYSGTMVFSKQKPLSVTYFLELRSTIMKGGSLPVSTRIFIWFVYIPLIPRTAYCVWITAWSGRMRFVPICTS